MNTLSLSLKYHPKTEIFSFSSLQPRSTKTTTNPRVVHLPKFLNTHKYSNELHAKAPRASGSTVEPLTEMVLDFDEEEWGRSGMVEVLECLEREAIMGEDEGKEPSDYNRRAHIFDKSSRVFQALKDTNNNNLSAARNDDHE